MSAGSEILEDILQEAPAIPKLCGKEGPELVTEVPQMGQSEGRPTDHLEARSRASNRPPAVRGWDPEHFTQEQILSLIQRVFFPGWPRPARQVVISAVDDIADSGSTCARVSLTMAERLPGTVCAIEVDRRDAPLERAFSGAARVEVLTSNASFKHAQTVQTNLWLLSANEFFAGQKASAAWLRNRLSELRREFDYVVIHSPAVVTCSETALIGQIADGVILVVDQLRTHRAAAQEAKQILQSANAKLLGVVLSEREFPIPEGIYTRL
jgi:Mrp family chromosome partitioning ATPase